MSQDPNYIDRIAQRIGKRMPGCEASLLRIYALLALTLNIGVTSRDVHDAWAVWRLETQPEHRSLVPYGELSPVVQQLDEPYAAVIRAVAQEMGL